METGIETGMFLLATIFCGVMLIGVIILYFQMNTPEYRKFEEERNRFLFQNTQPSPSVGATWRDLINDIRKIYLAISIWRFPTPEKLEQLKKLINESE